MTGNQQVFIRELPRESVSAGNFDIRETALPRLSGGDVLVQHHCLSLDPYMRKRLADAVAGRFPLKAGDLMMGRTVGRVLESHDPSFRVDDVVLGWGGWQLFAVERARRLQKVDPTEGHPLSVHLGVLGRPGITAWLGVMSVAQVQAGDTVVVSSAAGAVGSLAGQMARNLGARVVGIAGGTSKCEAVVAQLGFDAAVDRRAHDFASRLRDATPEGVDVAFENVGGAILDATLDRMNENGRIAICGLISQYHPGAAYGYANFARVLDRALRMTGFRIDANEHLHARALADLRAWLAAGALRSWETVVTGLPRAPAAFVSMLEGRGMGKTLVQLT